MFWNDKEDNNFILSNLEEKALNAFIKHTGNKIQASTALLFLRANDFKIEQAVNNYNFYNRRTKHLKTTLYRSIPLLINGACKIRDLAFLKTLTPGQAIPQGCICIPRSADRNGSPLIIIYGRYLSELVCMAPEDILAACIYLANAVIEQQPACLRYGCALLIDLQGTPWTIQKELIADVTYSNENNIGDDNTLIEESELLNETIRLMITFFKDTFPIKWKNVLLYKPWWWLKWKQTQATLIFSEDELWKHISLHQLPLEFGGSCLVDSALLLRDLLARAQKNKEETSCIPKIKQKEKSKQTAKDNTRLNFVNPWDIVQSVIPNLGSKNDRSLSKDYADCTLNQVKKSLSKDLNSTVGKV